jgi:hypothetical protein
VPLARRQAEIKRRKLSLHRLSEGKCKCIPKGKGRFLAEAASFCIDKEGHALISTLEVVGDHSAIFDLRRMPVDDQMVRAFKDPQEATEFGAEGIAISLVSELTSFQAVERAVTGTGIDYWLANKDDDELNFAARLEVSGIQSGGEVERKNRVRGKLKQTDQSDDRRIPAMVIVVEFSDLVAEVANKP